MALLDELYTAAYGRDTTLRSLFTFAGKPDLTRIAAFSEDVASALAIAVDMEIERNAVVPDLTQPSFRKLGDGGIDLARDIVYLTLCCSCALGDQESTTYGLENLLSSTLQNPNIRVALDEAPLILRELEDRRWKTDGEAPEFDFSRMCWDRGDEQWMDIPGEGERGFGGWIGGFPYLGRNGWFLAMDRAYEALCGQSVLVGVGRSINIDNILEGKLRDVCTFCVERGFDLRSYENCPSEWLESTDTRHPMLLSEALTQEARRRNLLTDDQVAEMGRRRQQIKADRQAAEEQHRVELEEFKRQNEEEFGPMSEEELREADKFAEVQAELNQAIDERRGKIAEKNQRLAESALKRFRANLDAEEFCNLYLDVRKRYFHETMGERRWFQPWSADAMRTAVCAALFGYGGGVEGLANDEGYQTLLESLTQALEVFSEARR